MTGGTAALIDVEGRSERRDEVLHRARATASDGTPCPLLIVNLSPGGLMARSDRVFAIDERISVDLPGIGATGAEVRWALGGRIGCRFLHALSPDTYDRLLRAMSPTPSPRP